MIGAWMLYTLAVTALLLCAALPTEYVVRALGRPTRFVWAAAILIAAALPVARLFLRRSAPSATPTTIVRPVAAISGPTFIGGSTPPAPSRTLAAPIRMRETVASLDVSPLDRWNRILLVAWIGSSIVALAYLALGLTAVHRMERRLARDTIDGHPVLVSADVGPALFGVRRARIVMPRWVLALAESERRIILTHEAEHASAQDPALLLASLVALALQPWNVALWLVVARLRYAIEADCDARVLTRSVDARSYGLLLVRVHAQSAPFAGARLAFVGTTSKLEGRIRRIVRGKPRLVSATVAGATLASAVLALSAWATPLPTHAHRGLSIPPVVNRAARAVTQLAGDSPVVSANPVPATPVRTLRADTVPAVVQQLDAQQPGTCGGSVGSPHPPAAQLQRWARERHPELMNRVGSAPTTVISFIVDPATCTVVRDTTMPGPSKPPYQANEIFSRAFPTVGEPNGLGLSAGGVPGVIISYGLIGTRTSSPNCGFDLTKNETCSIEGGVIIRVVDSMRVLVAVVREDATVDSLQKSHLFMFTSAEPVSALVSRAINYAHVEYSSNELYIVSRSGADPSLLFRVPTADQRIRATAAAVFDHGGGLSVYLWQGLTVDRVRRLKPAAVCTDGVARPSCYEVDGRVIRFPY